MPDPIDPYKILQVDSEAEDEVIQAAYRRLARKYHPDLATAPEAGSRMAAINAAWELIGDPGARQAFDRQRVVLSAARKSGNTVEEVMRRLGAGLPRTTVGLVHKVLHDVHRLEGPDRGHRSAGHGFDF